LYNKTKNPYENTGSWRKEVQKVGEIGMGAFGKELPQKPLLIIGGIQKS
jgi:hypothetical protein